MTWRESGTGSPAFQVLDGWIGDSLDPEGWAKAGIFVELDTG
jgi:hypothetical protein